MSSPIDFKRRQKSDSLFSQFAQDLIKLIKKINLLMNISEGCLCKHEIF